jgi:hypothetical protein
MQQYFEDVIMKLCPQQQVDLHQEEEEPNEELEEAVYNAHEHDLVMLRVQRLLLPLLMKEEFLSKDLWAPDVNSAAVGAALHSIVMELRQHRNNSLSTILETVQVPTSSNTKENPSVVPTLKAYSVSLKDRCVHTNLLCDLVFLNRKHNKSSMFYCKI